MPPSPSYVPLIRTGVDTTFANVTVTSLTTSGTVTVAAATATAVALALNGGGALFDQYRLREDGRMDWGPGTGARDTTLYRSGAGVLTTDGSLRLGGSLGVGNSAAATTPGAVVRKVEIFDTTGTSLGFLPVYNSIT